jgi:hypothetical protein
MPGLPTEAAAQRGLDVPPPWATGLAGFMALQWPYLPQLPLLDSLASLAFNKFRGGGRLLFVLLNKIYLTRIVLTNNGIFR